MLNLPKVIYLYDEGVRRVNLPQLKKNIVDNFGKIKICLIKLRKEVVKRRGLLFDFIETEKAFVKLLYATFKNSCHIILTPKLFATFDEQKKLHIRPVIFSYPPVISIPGIVEGPAKPKKYYRYKQRLTQLGIWQVEEPSIKKKFKERFIDYEDKRLTEVLKGYIAQALFFYIMDEPFCKEKFCRLYNAHWQEDLIYAQITSGKFCSKHEAILKNIREKVNAYDH